MSEAGTFVSSTDTRLTALVGSTSKINPLRGASVGPGLIAVEFCLKHFGYTNPDCTPAGRIIPRQAKSPNVLGESS